MIVIPAIDLKEGRCVRLKQGRMNDETVAYKDPEFVKNASRAFPDKIILGIDARGDKVAVEGWTEEVDLTPVNMVRQFEEVGISAIIYTDIHRDGMQTGPNAVSFNAP